jgi:acetyl esterase
MSVNSPVASPDPQIQQFMDRLADDYSKYPQISSVDVSMKRIIAAQVRARWAIGGPEMYRTRELFIEGSHGSLRIRLHYPTPGNAQPVMVYAHGGGWMLFSLDTHDRVMREYAAGAGVIVAGIDYALSPEARFPSALEDMTALVHWLHANAESIGADPRRIAVGGDSAGANLSITTCLKLRDEGMPEVIKAMVLNYGAFDSSLTHESCEQFAAGEYLLARDEMADFWQNYFRDPSDALNPLACPAQAELHLLPPAFMAIAELDILRDENLAMAAKLKAAGVNVAATVYPGTVHGFIEAAAISDVTQRAFEETCAWLRTKLR